MRASSAVTAVFTLLLSLVALGVPAPAAAQVEVSASPSQFSPGARVRLFSEGLALNTSYRLRLEQARPGVQTWNLADFNSGSLRQVSTTVAIPDAPAGAYEVVLYRNALGLTRLAATDATVVPGLGVVPSPASAAPGKSVRLTVSNLAAGSLRVLYAGGVVLGPVAVGEGSWQGKFIVPRDRPASLPATVPVVVENLVGRTVVRRGSVNFNALVPSPLPRLGLTLTQQPTTTLDPGAPFVIAGTLRTDDGVAPRGTQSMYWRDPSGRVMPLDSAVQVAPDGTFTMSARAPDPFRDGYLAIGDRAGIVSVVSRGTSVHTDATEDGIAAVGSQPEVVVDGRDAGTVTFTVEVLGDQPGTNDPPLQNAYVEVQQEFRHAFGFALPGGGSASAGDQQAFMSLTANQFRDLRRVTFPPVTQAGYGCDVTVYRRQTPSNGAVTFTFNPDTIAQTNLMEQVANCADGDCSDGAPGAAAKGGANFGRAGFVLWIYAAHLGYRTTPLSLTYDGDTGQIIDETSGQPLANNRLTVRLQPSQAADYDLRNLRIDGLGEPAKYYVNCPFPVCYYTPTAFAAFAPRYTYPDPARWPDALFDVPAASPMVRLQVDPAATGLLRTGRLRIPGFGDVPFSAASGIPACVLDQTTPVEYVAPLPDLRRAPASAIVRNDSNGTVTGGVAGTIELAFGSNPTRTFPIRIGTQLPPPGLEVGNPAIASLRIDWLGGRIYGDYEVLDASIPVASPGHGIGRLDNESQNESTFDFMGVPERDALERIEAVSNNDVAGEAGGPRASEGVFFGFTSPAHTTPQPIVLFDTGTIPLFRYSWGIPPLAEATLGADFWMASDLAFYGQMRTQGLNATIDPTVEGGVDLFFDLDVLLGLVSASIAAETSIGVTMRSVVGQGGLAHLGISQQNGRCFRFDLVAVWEACAVGFCEGGREPLIQEREPDGCAVGEAPKALAAKAFDLARPRPTATAMANDGRGNTITVGVDDRGALLATHLTGTSVVATRIIAASTVAVQHVDVVFHGANRALAVWSENRLTAAQVADLLRTQRGRAFDDIARTQRLRFSVFDGRAWSAPADLTSGGNDGKPQLAACLAEPRSLSFDCPSGGEVTAVWERDANANLDAPDIEVWAATWTPARGWERIARVSAGGASSDMLPSVAYRNGTPIVAWAHNPAGHFASLGGRRVAYRFLDGSSPQVVATAFGSGVGWVSIGVSPADAVVIAFTRAQDAQGFVGNRQALAAARATSCSAGTCSFLVTEPRDGNGRQFRIERPSVSFDDDGTPVIGFRGLAFGPTAGGARGLAGDPPGMLLGTGELALVRIHSFAQASYTARLVNLSGNALQHWKPEFAFDPTAGGVLALSQEAVAPAGVRSPLEAAKNISPDGFVVGTVGKALAAGAVLRTLDGGPDFALREVALSRSVVATGQPLQLTLSLVNEGQAYDPAVHGPVRVAAAWNAPPGAGAVAGTFDLATAQAANAARAVSMALTVPAGVRNDERQTLFVEIVAGDLANASTGAADQWRLVLNEMPVPQDVVVDPSVDSPLVAISWGNPVDARVAGWRVWKRDPQGAWRHLGSTRHPGYLDYTGVPGSAVQYRVAAYSANGLESEPSAAAYAFIPRTVPDALFGNGFEPAVAPAP